MTQKIDLKNIDKSNWKTFRFDQIAKKISETVDPNTTVLTIYVGLEHLDAESIHIKRFGTPADVSGGKLKCYPGDVIFGKRRAYQRKAAIVDFEGICSAHAFVLRPIPEVIDPRLFPFFLHSDLFMHCAVDISVGGLSPTINWGQLKEQEFLLPPLAQQAQLAELLWAMDEVIEKEYLIKDKLIVTQKAILNDLFNLKWSSKTPFLNSFFTSEFNMTAFSKICSESMFGPRFSSNLYNDNGNVACLRTTDMDLDGNINLDTMPLAKLPEGKFSEHYLKVEDILISRSGTCGLTGVFKGFHIPVLPAAFIIRFRMKEDVNSNYIKTFFNSEYGKAITSGLASGAVQKNLTSKALLNVRIPLPKKSIQDSIVNILYSLGIEECTKKITSSKALQKSLINQIF